MQDGLYAKFHTSKGEILVNLEYQKTPGTVGNFVALAQGNLENTVKPQGTPYYDGLNFHRVIADFMIQGGCPLGTGTGDPGYKFDDEFHPDLKHSGPGVLAMANSGPGSNGSQFYITHVETSWLDGKHTVFGHVTEGQDVVNSIEGGDSILGIDVHDSTDALFAQESSKIDENEITQQLQQKLEDGNLQDANNDGVVDESDVEAAKEQITDEKKDVEPVLKAKDKIDFFLKEFPNNDYAIDLQFKKDLIINQLAAKELYVAKYYIATQKWIPAINRLKIIINDYDQTVFVEEALHRLVEIYFYLGLEEKSKKYAKLLGYNYNSGEWFKQSYKILNKEYKINKTNDKKNNESLLKKIINKIK